MNKKSFTIIKDDKNIKYGILFYFANENLNYTVYNRFILDPIEDNYI